VEVDVVQVVAGQNALKKPKQKRAVGGCCCLCSIDGKARNSGVCARRTSVSWVAANKVYNTRVARCNGWAGTVNVDILELLGRSLGKGGQSSYGNAAEGNVAGTDGRIQKDGECGAGT